MAVIIIFLNACCNHLRQLCFAVLLVSNLTRADGLWEPSAVLGDKLLAAVAFGCPALKTLEVGKT
jgi:hypothetical protein